jgi:YggT family protein
MSLVNPAPYNPLVLIVYGLTEPLLAPLRGFFPRGPGGLDFRALIFLVIALLAQQVLLKSLYVLVATWIGQSAGHAVAYGF